MMGSPRPTGFSSRSFHAVLVSERRTNPPPTYQNRKLRPPSTDAVEIVGIDLKAQPGASLFGKTFQSDVLGGEFALAYRPNSPRGGEFRGIKTNSE
jgi:hypothetical protein